MTARENIVKYIKARINNIILPFVGYTNIGASSSVKRLS